MGELKKVGELVFSVRLVLVEGLNLLLLVGMVSMVLDSSELVVRVILLLVVLFGVVLLKLKVVGLL